MSSDSTRTSYIPTLDGWRAVAIVAVMISHSQDTFKTVGWQFPTFLGITLWLRLGVDLFFAISGFLICNRLLHEMKHENRISLKGFYLRRAFRILPLYLFYLGTLFVLSQFASVPNSRAASESCFFFYRNYIDPPQGVYTNHFWSLSVEEHFYLLWPFFLSFVGLSRALWITPCLALLVHLWRSAEAHFHILASILPHATVLWRTDTRIDALLWGCFAAIVCFQHPVRFPAWSPFVVLIVLVGAIVGHFPALPLILALLFPLLIVTTISNPSGPLSRFLELRFLRWIGGLSYSLYIWQTIFLQRNTDPDPAWLENLKSWPLNYCVIIGLSIASHYLLEQPLIRMGRFFNRRHAASHLHPQPETSIP